MSDKTETAVTVTTIPAATECVPATMSLEATATKYSMVVILISGLVFIFWMLYRANASKKNPFEWQHLLMDAHTGIASKEALWAWGFYFLTVWFFIYATLRNRMTEGYFGMMLAAWVSPKIVDTVVNRTTRPATGYPVYEPPKKEPEED